MEESKIASIFESKKLQHNIQFSLKSEQIKIAASIFSRRNCLGFLPTGFGKTMCFVLNYMLCETGITLVISPLISLMEDQIRALNNWNFKSAKISGDMSDEERQRIAMGEYSFVFSSPEAILKPTWRKVLLTQIWQDRLYCIVLDEAHCLSEWGEDFRPDYKEMTQLRSFFQVPILALTATSTNRVKDDLLSILQLDVALTDIIAISADRPNIFICCSKRQSTDYESELHWLIEHIKINGKFSKKTLIYCRSIDVVSEIFISLKDALGHLAYADGVPSSSNLLVEMYHKCTHEDSKTRILSSFAQPNSTLRCVVATMALGMGINIPDIDLALHIGCPKSVTSYWQEAGRCARDGRQGFSYILYDNFTAALKMTDHNMSNIVKNPNRKCIREQILSNFINSDNSRTTQPCRGCTNTHCLCAACICCNMCACKCPCYERSVSDPKKFISLESVFTPAS